MTQFLVSRKSTHSQTANVANVGCLGYFGQEKSHEYQPSGGLTKTVSHGPLPVGPRPHLPQTQKSGGLRREEMHDDVVRLKT